MATGVPARAVIYARISMDRTGAGLGIDRQIADCKQLAEQRGCVLVDVFQDNDISAYSGRPRPGYRRMLDVIRTDAVDVVLAWHTDRLHRSPRELEEWIELCERHAVTTLSVRSGELDLSTAAGRMVARMLGAAARHESEQKSERVRRARQQAAESGRAHGPLGYGYRADQSVDEEQAAIIREVAIRILAGETLYAVAANLNERAVPTPGAGRWNWRTVQRVANGSEEREAEVTSETQAEIQRRLGDGEAPGHIGSDLNRRGIKAPTGGWRSANLRQMIRRGALCGYREWEPSGRGQGKGDLIAQGNWAPIIDRRTTERIRALLDAPERDSGRMRKYELTGILVCGKCGARMSGRVDTRDDRRVYSCSAQPGMRRCGKTSIKAEPVEALVDEAVQEVLSRSPLLARSPDAEVTRRASGELEAARQARDLLVRQLAQGELSAREWSAARPLLDARVRRAEASLGPDTAHLAILNTVPRGRKVRKWWDAATVDQRHAVVGALIERVVIGPAERGRNVFDPRRVGTPVWRA